MDLYSTTALNGVVDSLKRPTLFLLNSAFGTVMTSDSEEIYFDVLTGNRKLAPFVSPLREGKVVATEGYTTKSFKPAYVKPKHVVKPGQAFKRAAGETIGGTLAPAQRMAATVAQILMNDIESIDRRLEWMAASALRTGKITVSGEGYGTVELDFGRNSAHTVTLSGGDRWSESTATPLEDLDAWTDLIHKNEGATANKVVMDPDAFKAFKSHASVKDILDLRKAKQGEVDLGPSAAKGARFRGLIGDLEIWTYSDWYEDDVGVTQPILPSGTVILFGDDVEGIRAFGAIHDEAAGLQAREYFSKSWVQEDPSVRFIMTQSAPLVVPQRPNATLGASVL